MILGKNQKKELTNSKFAGSDFKFLKLESLVDSLHSDSVIDPPSYQLHPGCNSSAIYVNDKRPLLIEQCQTSDEIKVFAIMALRKHRAEKSPQILNTDPQLPPSCS